MDQFFIQHGIDNVWSNLYQDRQFVLSAQRITKPVGVINSFELMRRNIVLPSQKTRYHVYQIGSLHPLKLGLLNRKPSWVKEVWSSFATAINELKLITNLYDNKGLELPRFNSYYMFSNEGDLILAIPEDSNLPVDYGSDIFLRVYSNAYFQSNRSDLLVDQTVCLGREIKVNQDITDIHLLYQNYSALDGYTYCYVNGVKVDALDPFTMQLYDTVELVFDSSISKVVKYRLGDLLTFDSTLDGKIKYLLHSPGDVDNIDFYDDVDIHILYEFLADRHKGYYYYSNVEDSHRMVTHSDYSVVVDYISFIANSLNDRISDVQIALEDMVIEVKVRKSGYLRPLVYDNSRLFELYKLDDESTVQAMLGINATVPVWQAAVLEHSAYAELMRSWVGEIDMSLMQKAYGYNAMSKLVGDTPTKTVLENGQQTIELPYALVNNSTVYDYDENGHLLRTERHLNGTMYTSPHGATRLVEVISGIGTNNPDVRFGEDNINLPEHGKYRVYMSYLNDGVSNGTWTDITDGPLYGVVNDVLVWNNLESDYILMVRTDLTFLDYELEFPSVEGNLFFTFSEVENRGDGAQEYILPVPLGELDIWLNGKSLIKNLDYKVVFPKVYILNKKHINQPAGSTLQKIHVRYTGFSNSELEMDPIEDYGFIEHGVLSNNSKYDIRDDKVMRMTVDGSVIHRDDLIFSELHQGISIVNVSNGKPYQVKDIVVPLESLVDENTYTLRDKSILIDKSVSDYLTLKLPQPERNGISSIVEKYPVVSPFIATIISHLRVDIITLAMILEDESDNGVLAICNEYEELLQFDPISDSNKLNEYYVEVHPHILTNTIDLTLVKYRFLLKVVDLYTNGLINISSFVTFSS